MILSVLSTIGKTIALVVEFKTKTPSGAVASSIPNTALAVTLSTEVTGNFVAVALPSLRLKSLHTPFSLSLIRAAVALVASKINVPFTVDVTLDKSEMVGNNKPLPAFFSMLPSLLQRYVR